MNSLNMKLVYPVLFFLLLSCSNAENKEPVEDVTASTHTPEAVVALWNDAIVNKRWEQLSSLYADQLYYYSKKKTKENCIQHKIRKLNQTTNFTQSIADVTIQQTYYNTYEAQFDKTFSIGQEKKTVSALLSMTKDKDGRWKITQESDVITRNNKGKICSCSDFWVALHNGGEGNYYKLSRDGIYYGSDHMYALTVDYSIENDGGDITFIDRELSDQSTSGFLGGLVFDLKTETMSDMHGGSDADYDQRFYKKISTYCQ